MKMQSPLAGIITQDTSNPPKPYIIPVAQVRRDPRFAELDALIAAAKPEPRREPGAKWGSLTAIRKPTTPEAEAAFESVCAAVAEEYAISLDDLKQGRTAKHSTPRMTAILILKRAMNLPDVVLSRLFLRDVSTIRSAIWVIESKLWVDSKLAKFVESETENRRTGPGEK